MGIKATPEQIAKLTGEPLVKRHKYGAQRTIVDGISFASKREAKRYGELKILAAAGEIFGLTLQPRFKIIVKNVLVCEYVGDFSYHDKDGMFVVEDAKGFKTQEYKLKKKLMEAVNGIRIREV